MGTVQIDVSRKTARGRGRERERRFPPLSLSLSTSPIFSHTLISRHAPICERLEKAMLTIKAACVWLRLHRRSCRSCEPALTFPLLYPPRSPVTFDIYFCNFCSASRVSYMLFEKEPADYTKARVTLYFWSNLTIKSVKPRCIFCRLDYGNFLHQLLSEPKVIL